MALFTKKTPTAIDPEQRALIENAQSRLRQKKNLYRHFIVFLAGGILFIILNLVLGIGQDLLLFNTPWFVYAILIWTFFLLIHFINVFLLGKFMSKEWEKNQIDLLVSKQKLRIAELEEQVAVDLPLPQKKSAPLSDPQLPLEDQNTPL